MPAGIAMRQPVGPTGGIASGGLRLPSPGGGGGGGAASQGAVLRNSGGGGGGTGGGGTTPPAPKPKPTPVIGKTPVDPMQKNAYNQWNQYNSGLADDTNAEITRELSRARDQLSVGLKGETEAALGRNADPSLFTTRFMEGGRRSLNDLQGKLADVALGRRAEALGGLTNAADQAAAGQRELHLGTLANRVAEERVALEAADIKQRTEAAAYQRLLDMMGTIGSGLSSGLDYGYGGGSAGILG